MSKEKAARFKRLGEILSKYEFINKYDANEAKEAWTLAHAFIDLDESFNKFSNETLPKLFDENLSEKEIQELLIDIGEELRHILYHIKDPKFYDYLKEELK